MSLETKIEMLTKSIDALNANLVKFMNVPCANDPVLAAEILDREMPNPAHIIEDIELEGAKQRVSDSFKSKLTHESIQASLMVIVRKNPKMKPKIKALLSDLSASKVSDLAPENFESFNTAIKNL